MIFKNKKYFLTLLLVMMFGALAAQVANVPYRHGESLTYIMNYKWGGVDTDLGEAVTNLTYSDGMFHSVITGKTYRFYDLIFKVRERFESKFHEYPIRPSFFYRDTYEGKYTMKNTFYFNDRDYKIKARIERNGNLPKDTMLVGSEHTYDLVSLFYKVRTIDFNKIPVNVQQPISFAIDDDVYNFYYIYKGREVKKIQGIGTFNTLKFTVKLIAGSVFTGKEEMTIWVSDDGNKIPLLFESPILVGRVAGRLSKWSNLRYPLTSKIK